MKNILVTLQLSVGAENQGISEQAMIDLINEDFNDKVGNFYIEGKNIHFESATDTNCQPVIHHGNNDMNCEFCPANGNVCEAQTKDEACIAFHKKLRQAQTNAQQTHGEICSDSPCSYCLSGPEPCGDCIVGHDNYSSFNGRKLSPC